MKSSIKKFAAVSAIALGTAVVAAGVLQAAPYQIGDPVTVPSTANVENSIDVTPDASGLYFGTLGSMNHTVDVATFTVNPDSTYVEDPGGGWNSADPASIVVDESDVPVAVEIVVTGAFENTDLYVTYSNCVDLTDGTDTFTLSTLQDDLDAPTVGVGVAAGDWDCVADTGNIGQATTDGTGNLTFNVGGTITTDGAADAAYTDGAYAGSFDMTFSY